MRGRGLSEGLYAYHHFYLGLQLQHLDLLERIPWDLDLLLFAVVTRQVRLLQD